MTDPEHTDLGDLPFPTRRTREPEWMASLSSTGSSDPLGGIPTSLKETVPLREIEQQADARRRRGDTGIPRFKTLETMYASFPEIKSHGSLRIVRVSPEWYTDSMSGHRIRISGILADGVDRPLSTQDVATSYGGYKFTVYGMLDVPDRENSGGPPQRVDRAVVDLEFPLEPNLATLPIAGSDEGTEAMPAPFVISTPYGPRGRPMVMNQQMSDQGGVSPILGFAERMAASQRAAPAGPSDQVLGMIGKQSQETANAIKELSQQQVEMLQHEVQSLRREIAEERRRADDVSRRPHEIVDVIQGVAALNQSTRTSASSEEIRSMKDDHAKELARLSEENMRRLEMEKREKDSSVASVRAEMQARLVLLEDRQKDLMSNAERRERELREDFERRERSLREEHKRQLDMLREMYDGRMKDMQGNFERELRTRDMLDKNSSATILQSHAIELRSIESDRNQKAVELQQKTEMLDVHLKEQAKPITERVAELKRIAEDLGLTSPPPTVASSAGPAEKEKFYETLIMEFIKNADKVVPQIKSLLGKEAPKHTVPMQSAYPIAPEMTARALPAGQPGQRRRRVVFADADAAPISLGEEPPAGVYRQAAPPPAPTQAVERRPVRAPAPAPTSSVERQPEPEIPRASVAENIGAAPPWSEFRWIEQIPPENVMGIITTLMQACVAKISPADIAQGMVEQLGSDNVLAIPKIVEIGRFVESLRADSATRETVLATGKGRRYVQDVWNEFDRLSKQKQEKPATEA